jgi:DNA-binding MarR family transcriptional regulator
MNITTQTILEAIHASESSPEAYVPSTDIAEHLITDLDSVEAHLQIIEQNGLVRLAPTSDHSGQWEARLTQQGRSLLGERAVEEYRSQVAATSSEQDQGNLGAVEEEEIETLEAIRANARTIAEGGDNRMPEAITQLTDAVTAHRDLEAEQRERLLDLLHDLSREALNPDDAAEADVAACLAALQQEFLTHPPLARQWALWEATLASHFDV